MLLQRPTKGLVGQDTREIVHAAVAFGLADDGDHLVRDELPTGNACLEPGGILHGLELDLCDFYRHPLSYVTLRKPRAHSPRIKRSYPNPRLCSTWKSRRGCPAAQTSLRSLP